MKISTKGRYGLKAMIDLAENTKADGTCVSLNSIADRQGISEHYLEQLIASLKKAGLVKSIRGAQGGYNLCCEADNITVGDILRALEGPLAPVDCVIESDDHACDDADNCATRMIWQRIYDKVNEVVDDITLDDLLTGKNGDESR